MAVMSKQSLFNREQRPASLLKSFLLAVGIMSVGLLASSRRIGTVSTEVHGRPHMSLGAPSLLASPSALRQEKQRRKEASSSTPGQQILHEGLKWYSAERIWDKLLEEGSEMKNTSNNNDQRIGVVMEVGMYWANQCVQAAKAGFEAHCFEPSPNSFERVQKTVKEAPKEVVDRIHLYNQAAGSTSQGTLPFKVMSAAGTGDHVGSHNMWTMEKEEPAKQGSQADSPFGDVGQVVQVQQVKVDDVIAKLDQNVFLIKVDTQGFEPAVFSGLQESIRTHKIKYALFEFWPKGMDLLADKMGQCVSVEQVLKPLVQAGYRLYPLSVMALNKYAPQGWKDMIAGRPFDTLENHCQWYYQVEAKFPSETYKMGYWSDMLAVAPDAPVPVDPQSNLGTILKREQQLYRAGTVFGRKTTNEVVQQTQ